MSASDGALEEPRDQREPPRGLKILVELDFVRLRL